MPLLLNTKLRRKLLAHSFTHPDSDFYVRELAGIINEDAGNLSRELRKFEEEGIFFSSIRGRIKLYSLNKKYALYEELKKIIFKTEGVEGSLRELVSKYSNITCAFVYGSYAKEKEKKTSDIDLVLIGTFPEKEFVRELRVLESKLSREINFTSYKQDEFETERKTEGGFLNMVLKGKVIILKGAVPHG